MITLIGTVFNEEDGPVVFTWDFGDYSEAQGEIVTHSYTVPGTYNVKLSAIINNSIYEDTATDNIYLLHY
jgi:PKD repeat protein